MALTAPCAAAIGPRLMLALLLTLAAAPETRVLVLDLEAGEGVPVDAAAVLTAAVANAAARDGALAVVTVADLRNLQNVAAEKALCGIDDSSCLTELASALDLEHVIHGRVARLDTSYVVQLSLFDTARARSSGRASWSADDLDTLVRGAADGTDQLLGRAPQVEESSSMLWGGAALGAGALVAGTAVIGGLVFNSTLTSADSSRDEKDFAATVGRVGVIGGALAAGALGVVGVVLMTQE